MKNNALSLVLMTLFTSAHKSPPQAVVGLNTNSPDRDRRPSETLALDLLREFDRIHPQYGDSNSCDSADYSEILSNQSNDDLQAIAVDFTPHILQATDSWTHPISGFPAFDSLWLNIDKERLPCRDKARWTALEELMTTFDPGLGPIHAPTLDALAARLTKLADQHPALVKIQQYGSSRESRPLTFIEVGEAEAERTILITSAMHGLEAIGPSVVMDFASWLVSSAEGRKLLKDNRFVLVPIANPDGYNISLSRIGWRKNAWKDHQGFVIGIDLNRNFPVPEAPKDKIVFDKNFQGEQLGSEPEVQALMRLADGIKPDVALDLHGNAHFFYTPESSEDADDDILFFRNLCSKLKAAVPDENGHPNIYTCENKQTFFSGQKSAGTLPDWLWHKHRTVALTMEFLNPDDLAWPSAEKRAKSFENFRASLAIVLEDVTLRNAALQ